MPAFRGGLVFKARRLCVSSTLGVGVIKKKKMHAFMERAGGRTNPGSMKPRAPATLAGGPHMSSRAYDLPPKLTYQYVTL